MQKIRKQLISGCRICMLRLHVWVPSMYQAQFHPQSGISLQLKDVWEFPGEPPTCLGPYHWPAISIECYLKKQERWVKQGSYAITLCSAIPQIRELYSRSDPHMPWCPSMSTLFIESVLDLVIYDPYHLLIHTDLTVFAWGLLLHDWDDPRK